MPKIAEKITYVPGQHDPSHVKWGGHVFQANVPKEIKGDPDGTSTEKLNHEIIERAKGNPHFIVGDGKQPRTPREKAPTDAKGYLAYFVGWLKDETFETPEELIARFARDRELQAKCDVGPDDFARVGELFAPRLHELAKACDMSEAQVAAVWVNHGYNQLPW
ncbi:hypothetical protein ACKWRH_21610 [Bradyrhizobium sp. Pa8]|uniref:hypothetical protein n=1 Tax=Bradyrhizobium sp. Pa8 TaxID=3386552 RepID=UPI00403F6135